MQPRQAKWNLLPSLVKTKFNLIAGVGVLRIDSNSLIVDLKFENEGKSGREKVEINKHRKMTKIVRGFVWFVLYMLVLYLRLFSCNL